MVISKCVPLEISRKRFSDFTKNYNPEQMIFVGYKYDQDGVTKRNVQMKYEHIKQDIVRYIEQNGGLGGGGEGGTPPDGYIEVDVKEIFFPTTVSAYVGQDGEVVIERNQESWDENWQTNIINLKKKQGCLEINGGGNYTEEYIFFANPVVGSVSHVVVDNTGLPTGGDTSEAPIQQFKLYYGSMDQNYGAELLMTVPAWHRGIVQILHTTDTDVIIGTSCSQAYDLKNKYVTDMMSEDEDITNDPIDMTPLQEGNDFEINMDEKKGYLEFQPKGHPQYIFWFEKPQLGSNTYIVIDNTEKNYYQDVDIWYGKKMRPDTEEDNIKYKVTTVGKEKCVIQVFHSLSADIIVKVTKV